MVGAAGPITAPAEARPAAAAPPAITLQELLKPRFLLLCVLLLSYVWRFHDLSPAIAPLRLAAVGTVLSWVFLVVTRPPAPIGQMVRHPALLPLLLGVLWVGLTVPSALDSARAWESWWGVHFKTLTMTLFVMTCLDSMNGIRRAMAIHVLGAAALAFFYAKSGFPLWGSPVPMYDVNDMALHLNMALPFTIYFAVRGERRWIRNSCWLLTGAVTVCVLMTQSRGAFLTIGLFALLVIFYARTLRLWMRLLPPVLVVCTYVFAPPATKERLSTLFSPQDDYNMHDDEGRIEIWKRGLGYMRDHPVTGVGMTNFPVAEATLSDKARQGVRTRGMVSHNSFLEVGAEGGFPALALFVAMIGGTLVPLVRIRTRLRRRLGSSVAGQDLVLMSEALILSVVAYCVGGFFLSMGYLPMLYSVVAIAIGFTYWAHRLLQSPGHPQLARRGRVDSGRTAVSRPPALPVSGLLLHLPAHRGRSDSITR